MLSDDVSEVHRPGRQVEVYMKGSSFETVSCETLECNFYEHAHVAQNMP
jgi:hypothetical protein